MKASKRIDQLRQALNDIVDVVTEDPTTFRETCELMQLVQTGNPDLHERPQKRHNQMSAHRQSRTYQSRLDDYKATQAQQRAIPASRHSPTLQQQRGPFSSGVRAPDQQQRGASPARLRTPDLQQRGASPARSRAPVPPQRGTFPSRQRTTDPQQRGTFPSRLRMTDPQQRGTFPSRLRTTNPPQRGTFPSRPRITDPQQRGTFPSRLRMTNPSQRGTFPSRPIADMQQRGSSPPMPIADMQQRGTFPSMPIADMQQRRSSPQMPTADMQRRGSSPPMPIADMQQDEDSGTSLREAISPCCLSMEALFGSEHESPTASAIDLSTRCDVPSLSPTPSRCPPDTEVKRRVVLTSGTPIGESGSYAEIPYRKKEHILRWTEDNLPTRVIDPQGQTLLTMCLKGDKIEIRLAL